MPSEISVTVEINRESEPEPESSSSPAARMANASTDMWESMTSQSSESEQPNTQFLELLPMNTLTSTPTAADFILEEVSPKFRQIASVTGGTFEAGTVLSRTASTDAYGECDPLDTDIAVLYARVDASDADQNGLFVTRLGVLKENYLTWPELFETADIDAVKAAMEAKHLITA